jgi:pimeloyl-ACP methyl ester carboxylesterase
MLSSSTRLLNVWRNTLDRSGQGSSISERPRLGHVAGLPETRYARSGETHIAFQVIGDADRDLVLLPGAFSHVEHQWEEPSFARFLRRLASFSRLIVLDVRGTGLSDRAAELPTLEEQIDDVLAVLDAVGSERAALFGLSQGGGLATLFAAAHPARTAALVLFGAYARSMQAADFSWGWTPAGYDELLRLAEEGWGSGIFLPRVAPSVADDASFKVWWSKQERLSGSPGTIRAFLRAQREADVRHVLPAIQAPTLVIQRADDAYRRVEHGRYFAEAVPDAKYVELPGRDNLPYVGDQEAVLDEVEEFLTGVRHSAEPDRVLATVLFTDIVGSTVRAAELGDGAWRDLLDRHHAVVRREVEHGRGREIDTAGDGVLATFDGPARAIRAAAAIAERVRDLGLEVRSGLHTGEVELAGDLVRGIAVHIGARTAALAGPGEVLVTSTVKDLVAGSGIDFEDRGAHALKGVPGEWRIFHVAAA